METFNFEDAALKLVGGESFAYGPQPTQKGIADFEQSVGAELPDDYKKFLLQTNGGSGGGYVVWFRNYEGVWNSFGIDVLNGIGTREEWSELSRDIRNMDVAPLGFLPIAYDSGGNYLCLNLNKEEAQPYGSIYFLDHEESPDSPCALAYVAPSFTGFLKLIELTDEEAENLTDDEIETALRNDDADAIEKIIKEKRFRLNQAYGPGKTLAGHAMFAGKRKVFERLVAMGALVPQFSLFAHKLLSEDEIIEYIKSTGYNK